MRLSGMQRLGIAISILWALGATIYQRNADIEAADGFAEFAYKVCVKTSEPFGHRDEIARCEKERKDHMDVWLKGSWSNVAFLALAPIPLGWLAGLILVNVGRAQVIGFRAVLPWRTLSFPKKAAVIFCVLTTAAAILLGITVIMNLYVDTKVPVSLGLRATVIRTGDDLISAEGTWTRSGLTQGAGLGYPLQTSRIDCYRSARRCSEARAIVSGNTLMTELVEYEVESWSTTTVVFKNEALCAIEVFTIDLKTESVNGVGHLINKDGEYCKRFAIKEENWSYRLSDGFKVYWEHRQKARPLPLRLVQTFFGN